jgi:hypothetical protein
LHYSSCYFYDEMAWSRLKKNYNFHNSSYAAVVQPPTTTDAGGTQTTTDSSIAPTIPPTTAAANVGTTSTATAPGSTAAVRPMTTNVMDTTAMPGTTGDTSTVPGKQIAIAFHQFMKLKLANESQ